MIGNVSKSKGFKGDKGDIGPQGIQGEVGAKGAKGDSPAVVLRYDTDSGNLYYDSDGIMLDREYVESQNLVSRADVEAYVYEQTQIIKSDIDGIKSDIQNEAHFRGYLSTNLKIQELEATPNDFVYSAESNTKWVYNAENGWQNTGIPVPDQLTPASETTPLINGVASVGKEEAYARGDHRHPTDTTRASIEELNMLREYVDEKVHCAVVTALSNNTLVLNHNQMARLGTLTNLVLSVPAEIPPYYESEFSFSVGDDVMTIVYSETPIKWRGEDCDDPYDFYPQRNKSYEVSVKYLGNDTNGNPILVARVGVF